MPSGPCFIKGPYGYFSFESDFSSNQTATLLAVIKGYFDKCIVYDANGLQWKTKGIECSHKTTKWKCLLAYTFYNPLVTVKVSWKKPTYYMFDDLKPVYTRAVNIDDDNFTQFVDADELKQKISNAETFDQLVEVYIWMETDHTC